MLKMEIYEFLLWFKAFNFKPCPTDQIYIIDENGIHKSKNFQILKIKDDFFPFENEEEMMIEKLYHLEMEHVESLKSILKGPISLKSLWIGNGKANLILRNDFWFKVAVNEKELIVFSGKGYCEINNLAPISISIRGDVDINIVKDENKFDKNKILNDEKYKSTSQDIYFEDIWEPPLYLSDSI